MKPAVTIKPFSLSHTTT